jgi:hypothetical protein
MTRSTEAPCSRSSSSQRSLGAALLASFVAVLVLTASCRPQEEREDYRAGYADGLEDQRAHICGVMRDEDHAYEALRNERICP